VYTPQQMANYRAFDIPSGNDDPYVGLAAAYEVATTNPTIQADFDEMNVVYLGNYTSSTVLLACKEPVTALSDLDGLKVRANPPHADVFKANGAVVVSMPFPEVYQALDTGIIDCAQTYWSAIFAFKHQEVAKNITALNWSQNMAFGLVMNKDSFERLSPEQQKVLREIGYDTTMLAAKLAIGSTKAIRERILSDETVTLHTFDAENQAALIQAGRDTAKSFKGDPAVLDAYLAAADKYEAVLADKGYPWAQN
ncbi:MAG: TRAP transporter substrate-binding protein DctP, partial [Silicimonas sp.]|nr:TRAP transporter substrate-binding protein DctP [Silicimonas sp.]